MWNLPHPDTHHKLRNFARRYSPQDCDDHVHDTYLRLARGQWPSGWPEPILFHTLRWVILDALRKQRRQPPVELERIRFDAGIEERVLLHELLAGESQAQLVTDSELGGATPAELASQAGTTRNAINVAKHRALARMRARALAPATSAAAPTSCPPPAAPASRT